MIGTPYWCEEGQVFNPSVSECVAGDPETCHLCQIFRSTTDTSETTVTTTEPPTTALPTTLQPTTVTPPPPNLDEICHVFFAARPYPDLDFLYVGCLRGYGFLYQCRLNEIFDPEINECRFDSRDSVTK